MRQRPRRPGTLTLEAAEEIGHKALLFLAEDPGRLGRFLTESGLEPMELRQKAGTPAMLAAVLGHLLDDESMLLVFTTTASLDPADVHSARVALGGSSPWDSV